MTINCTAHSTKNAHWTCPKCAALLCQECVIVRDNGGIPPGKKTYSCPKCDCPADWLGVENIIAPFWHRIPQFFRYPLSIHPLMLMIGVAIANLFATGIGLLGLLLLGIAWLVVIKYSFEALKTTVAGNLKAPAISARSISDDFQQVFKQFGIYLAIFFIFGIILPIVGKGLALIFLLSALFLVPAMLILLVTTESLIHALNPLLFIRLAYRIGWGYVIMFLFLILLASAPAVAGKYITSFLPIEFQLPLFSMAKSYYTIISYHLMGYVLLQYRDRIGYEVDFEDFKDPTLEKTPDQPEDPETVILKQVNPIIKEGNLDEAISMVQELTNQNGIAGLALSERYFMLLQMKGQSQDMVTHGKGYLTLLVKNGLKEKGIKVFNACQKVDSAFLPNSDTLLKIGMWLNEKGKSKEAIRVFQNLIKHYPEAPEVPKAYFRAAQIFHDRFLDSQKAKKILNGIIKKYPGHEIATMAQNYLSSLTEI
jgi:tetratricopeptide (TPR) repeat protein